MTLKEIIRKKDKKKLKRQNIFRFKADFKVYKEFVKLLKLFKAKNILIYIPLNYEINICRFVRFLNTKYQIFTTFMQDKSLKMVKLRRPFFKKEFNIQEPLNSFLKAKIDLALVPILSIDANFARLGHGKGFYDRFFGDLSYRPIVVFVSAFDAINNINLAQNHDIKGDFYINSYKKYIKKELKNDRNSYFFKPYHRLGYRILGK